MGSRGQPRAKGYVSSEVIQAAMEQVDGSAIVRSVVAGVDPFKPLRDSVKNADPIKPLRDSVKNADPMKSLRDSVAQLGTGNLYREMVGSFDTKSVSRRAVTGPVSSNLVQQVMASVDVNSAYRKIAASISSDAAVRRAMLDIDITRVYKEAVMGIDPERLSGLTLEGMTEAVDHAAHIQGAIEQFSEIVCDLITVPATDDARAKMRAQFESVNVDTSALTDADKVGIATYLAVLAFSIFVWFYLTYPEASDVILDLMTPASWAIYVGSFVYERLNREDV
ncbi:hypothetical protein DUHN55_22000 [Helicobacter pylori]